MTTPIHLRPYTLADRPACLALFDANTPRFFDPSERAGYDAFLADPAGPYLVGTLADRPVAAGGLVLNPPAATLAWGMVHPEHQRHGLGSQLLTARIALARAAPGIETLLLDTSQHSRGFYERHGFAATAETPDGYGPGLARIDMTLSLRD